MFFYLSKIISYLLNPMAWIFMLLLCAVIIKKRKTKRIILIITIVLFYFFSNSFILAEVMRRWEAPMSRAEVEQHDVGVVLGGWIVNYDKEYDRVIFRHSIDRFLQALQLYKQGKIKKILITGGAAHLFFNEFAEADYVQKYMLQIGIPEEDIIVENKAMNTHENAVFTKQIIDSNSELSSVLLITSAVHMPRASACFNKEGLPHDIFVTGKKAAAERYYNFEHLFVPDKNALYNWHILIHEWLGVVAYKIAGYI